MVLEGLLFSATDAKAGVVTHYRMAFVLPGGHEAPVVTIDNDEVSFSEFATLQDSPSCLSSLRASLTSPSPTGARSPAGPSKKNREAGSGRTQEEREDGILTSQRGNIQAPHRTRRSQSGSTEMSESV
jgi:hypothetical protein